MSKRTCATLLAISSLSIACVEPPPAPVDAQSTLPPTLALRDLMNWVLDPAADVIWGAAGTIVTEEGEQSLAPTTDEGWDTVRNAAAVVVESGNLLMMRGRARDEGDWQTHAAHLIETGTRVLRAAEARNTDGVFDGGGDLYVVCVACHEQYPPETPPP